MVICFQAPLIQRTHFVAQEADFPAQRRAACGRLSGLLQFVSAGCAFSLPCVTSWIISSYCFCFAEILVAMSLSYLVCTDVSFIIGPLPNDGRCMTTRFADVLCRDGRATSFNQALVTSFWTCDRAPPYDEESYMRSLCLQYIKVLPSPCPKDKVPILF